MAKDFIDNETFEDTRILFRNFAGAEGQYNREGDRNFAIPLDEQRANRMIDNGWNVKYLKQREEDDAPQAYISVTVGFKGRPPRVVMLTSKGKTELNEAMIDILDWMDIASCDIIIRPYEWSVNGNSGVKAYLKTLYVKVNEDELEQKYSDVEDVNAEVRTEPKFEEE